MSLPISAIEGGSKKANVDISFRSKEGRSNFNEELLMSSMSQKHVAASGEKTLKTRKNGKQ